MMTDETPFKRKAPPFGKWKKAFLDKLRNSGNVRAACAATNISRATAYRRREKNQKFRQQWDSAIDDAVDLLESIAWSRATDSSDYLVKFLLQAHRPAKYSPVKKLEVAGKEGGPVSFSQIHSDPEWAKERAKLAEALQKHPEARDDVLKALRGDEESEES